MTKRKTVNVEFVVDEANRLLALVGSTFTPEVRQGIIHFVENILHESGRYGGFRYLTNLELPGNVLPGVRYMADGTILPYPARFENTDSTRVQYGLKG